MWCPRWRLDLGVARSCSHSPLQSPAWLNISIVELGYIKTTKAMQLFTQDEAERCILGCHSQGYEYASCWIAHLMIFCSIQCLKDSTTKDETIFKECWNDFPDNAWSTVFWQMIPNQSDSKPCVWILLKFLSFKLSLSLSLFIIPHAFWGGINKTHIHWQDSKQLIMLMNVICAVIVGRIWTSEHLRFFYQSFVWSHSKLFNVAFLRTLWQNTVKEPAEGFIPCSAPALAAQRMVFSTVDGRLHPSMAWNPPNRVV